MARLPRQDGPDVWFHVMNRGLARRTAFETRRDVRYFLSRLASSVRRGELEVHAFCVMTTHFHLLVRSPRGALSRGMRRIQNEYVRWFNRARRRDGALFRGRFVSRPVRSLAYRDTLVRYIDANPVRAGLVARTELFPHGSAGRHLQPGGTPWLERGWIAERVRAAHGAALDAGTYASTFGPLREGVTRLVELRLRSTAGGPDPLDELLEGAAGSVLEWMRRKARLADGTRIGIAVCDAESVERAIEVGRGEAGEWRVKSSQKHSDGWAMARAGLLRDLCARTQVEIGRRAKLTSSGVAKALERHRRMVLEDQEYALRVEHLAGEALRSCGWTRATPRAAKTVGKLS